MKKLKLLAALSICGTVSGLALGTGATHASADVDVELERTSLASSDISTYASPSGLNGKTYIKQYSGDFEWFDYSTYPVEDDRSELGYYGNTVEQPAGVYAFYGDSMDIGGLTISIDGSIITDFSNTTITPHYNYATYYYAERPFSLGVECTDPQDLAYSNFVYYAEKDVQKPTINGTTTLVVNVNNRPSVDEILTHFTAVDETDGVVAVEFSGDGDYRQDAPIGDYFIEVEACDRAGNYAFLEVAIKVVDIDKPVISGRSEYTVSYDACPTIEDIKGALTISDNYDSGLSFRILQDPYSANIGRVGTYSLLFNSTDSSSNTSDTFEVVVNVVDAFAPIITAPGTITVPTSTRFTLDELREKIHVADGYDGVLTNYTLTDNNNYAENYNVVGNYTFTITAVDSNGNQSTFTINIKTEDKVAPEIYVDSYVICLAEGETLTDAMIREYASKVLGIDVNSIVEVSGDYDTNQMGMYSVSLLMSSGETQDFTISVSDTEGNEPKPLGYFEQLWKDFTNVDNIFKFENWNWLHYTASASAGILVLAVLASFFKKKR